MAVQVLQIGKHLDKILSTDPLDDEKAMDQLKLLQSLSISLEDLEKTRIGMTVNRLRKQTRSTDVASLAKKLIKGWKKMLEASGKSKSKSGSGNGVQAESKDSPSPPSQGSSYVDAISSQQESAPSHPSAYSPAELPSSSSGTESLSEDMGARLAALPDLPSPDDELRDKSCSMLVNAIRKNSPSTPSLLVQRLARAVEHAVYTEIPRLDMKYRTRIRSRVLNLQDAKNPQLCANFVSGDITPEKLATMTADEMASQQMKQLRQLYTKDAIRDAQMATNSGTTTNLLKCSRCKKSNCTYNQLQTRSSDEPMTTFVFCNECGHRWKFN